MRAVAPDPDHPDISEDSVWHDGYDYFTRLLPRMLAFIFSLPVKAPASRMSGRGNVSLTSGAERRVLPRLLALFPGSVHFVLSDLGRHDQLAEAVGLVKV